MNNIEEFEIAYNKYTGRDTSAPVERLKHPVPGITYKYQYANDMLAFWNAARAGLIAQLEAAQKELFDFHNQEFQQRLANAEHQLYMKDLAIRNIKASRKAQFRKRLAAEAALSAVQLDATRWRALLSSPAICILGHAGLRDDNPIDGHYCHFGMEIWSHYEPYYDNKKAGELITRYADNMIASSLVEGNADAE